MEIRNNILLITYMIKKEYILLYKIIRKYELHYLIFDLILNYKSMNSLINIYQLPQKEFSFLLIFLQFYIENILFNFTSVY